MWAYGLNDLVSEIQGVENSIKLPFSFLIAPKRKEILNSVTVNKKSIKKNKNKIKR